MNKQIGLILLVMLLTASCAATQVNSEESKDKKEQVKIAQWPTIPTERISISPGHVRKVAVNFDKNWGKAKLTCNGSEVKFYQQGKTLTAYLALGYKDKSKEFNCNLEITKQQESKTYLLVKGKVEKFNYPTRFLNVDKKHVSLSPENVARWQKEMAMQKEIYSSGADHPYFTQEFKKPLRSKVTSVYGSKRVFNNKKDSWHSGTDFRAAPGTAVPAANRGKVVYVGELFFNGNTVIIDHGAGIFTMYCHLSKFKTNVGELVSRGNVIAYSGNTGRSTAPHLHWGVKVQDQWVDGRVLISEDKKIKKVLTLGQN